MTPLPDAQDFTDRLLGDLAPNEREACRRWYLSGDPLESICAECGIDAERFQDLRHEIRLRFGRLNGASTRKPPVSKPAGPLAFRRSA